MEKTFEIIMAMFMILITLCFLYQGVYVIIGLFVKAKRLKADKNHKYAVLISARNESPVIANLIESIKSQKYPQDLIEIFVVADNCTDNTADIARSAGVNVYERFNHVQVGKGYALNYLFKNIDEDYGIDSFDGYFVFDADNILEKDFIAQMNNVFDNGYRIVTSYRNSKNYGTNWISAGYGLWFLREAKFINNARMILGTSCAVSGTGFLVHKDIIKKNCGWKHYLLTEDIQFSTDNIIQGEKIGYCGNAILYDEQPVTFRDSWNQRLRWSRGFYQVFFKYGKNLTSGIVRKRSFSCYDMFITLMPGVGLSFITALLSMIALVFGALDHKEILLLCFKAVVYTCINTYITMFVLGLITTISERKRIYCKTYKKILYLFTFPVFMATYIPISIAAIFQKAKWKPIPHSVVTTAKEIRSQL